MEWHDAGALEALSQGVPRLHRIGTQHVLLVRVGDHVVATEPLCPHKFTPLEEGRVEEGCLVCPTHDAHFHLPSGQSRPGDEWAGELPVYPTRVRDGRIEIAL